MFLLNSVCYVTTRPSRSAGKERGICAALLLVLTLLLAAATGVCGQAAPGAAPAVQAPAKTWIDPDTGHRVIRLSDEPLTHTLYFNANAYTPDGRDMIYTSQQGIHVVNLATLETKLLVKCRLRSVVVGTRTRRVFFTKQDVDKHIYVVDVDTQQVTQLPGALPVGAYITSVNTDETLLAGKYHAPGGLGYAYYKLKATQDALANNGPIPAEPVDSKRERIDDFRSQVSSKATEMRFAAHEKESVFTTDIQSGEFKLILTGTDWLNHIQFSPTDPNLLMYAHEGPLSKVERIWTIRADGSENRSIHLRTSPTEGAAHEFWSQDGKTIWFDLSDIDTDGRRKSALAGYDIYSERERLFRLKNAESSVHFNSASDDSAFCGDGARPGYFADDRKWIELLHPVTNAASNGANPRYAGEFRTERLVNMSKNDYVRVEPNARFSPDNKLVIFQSDMLGQRYVFAVEVNKAATSAPALTTTTK